MLLLFVKGKAGFMFRFGTGFGLLNCPLSEFNADYHDDKEAQVAYQGNATTKYSTMKKKKGKKDYKKLSPGFEPKL